jgi:predicted metal-dependent phosphoesterase TrpH
MKKYDLHIHTHYSDCSINKPEDILRIAKKIGLNGIAITDHNSIKGAYEVKKLNKDKNFEVIIGEEIKTNYGEILALYIQEEIKKGDLFDVIDNIKTQDGIIVIAHPFRQVPWLKFKYPLRELQGKVDGIEVFNSRNIGFSNQKAENAIKGLKFARIGTSDAHIPSDIGNGYTLFNGNLRKAIKTQATDAKGTTSSALPSILAAAWNKRILSPLGLKK